MFLFQGKGISAGAKHLQGTFSQSPKERAGVRFFPIFAPKAD
jgi:hypothetical protein